MTRPPCPAGTARLAHCAGFVAAARSRCSTRPHIKPPWSPASHVPA